ncbi:DUF4191 family protein [Streptomyces sp. NRRL B-1677]|uniref:DUF4191 domain-containing protein n=1 Tax=Streptomyces klenkii TaxID=1420899 RepID=A0A3B0BQ48_9ACTN|nr:MULTISPECIES: DUF4191 domain-containing protein [Streptomyces]MBF6046978.1 DUF4191 family protein [Streptomyces sp. NRRL B-1677]RKN75445.1 DUF4191 domain-containing protein [Streptomyces klenkii]
MARKATPETEKQGRLQQIVLSYKMTREADPKVGLVVAGVGIVTLGVLLAVGFAIGHPVYLGILGVLLAFLAMAIVFGQRAQRAYQNKIEGQRGAAAAIMEGQMGRQWTTTTAVAFNRDEDMVHRAIGKAGIVLIGEGNPGRVKALLAAEKRKMARIVTDVPVHDFIIGNGEGQLPLKKLRTTLAKLPRVVPGDKVTTTTDRLRAMGDPMKNMPIPKGPLPKGARMPKGR